MHNLRFGPATIGLAMLPAACASAVGDADVGPYPDGGFYDGSNINVGHENPLPGVNFDQVLTSVRQANP